jgi:hypothetical protein
VRVIPLLVELEDFVEDHRLHGTLTADATEPAWNGYRLTVACACSVVFDRWVTPWDAEHDMICSALFASPIEQPKVSVRRPERASVEQAQLDRAPAGGALPAWRWAHRDEGPG